MSNTARLSRTRRLGRWLALAACIAVALLFLYGAIYSAWASGQESNAYALGWTRQAAAYACFALAALCSGIGLFRGIRTFPESTRGAAVFIVLAGVLALTPFIGRYLLIDSCLDRGGSWDREAIQCSDE